MLIGVWAFAVALTHAGSPPSLWHVQLAFSAASLVPIAMLRFAEHIHTGGVATSIVTKWFCLPIGVAFSLLSWSPWLVFGVHTRGTDIRPTYGPLHTLFAVYTLACFGFGIYVLYSSYRKSAGLLRLQSRYLLLAMAVPLAPALVTNLAVPMALGTSTHGRLGPVFSLVMVVLIAHVIIRHRFMDIRVVIRQSALYLAAFGAAGGILVLLLAGANLVFPDGHWFTALEILLALGVAVLFHPLKQRIQHGFDRYLYREPYNYQRVIRDTSRKLSETIDLPTILDCVGWAIQNTLKLEWTAVYLVDDDGERLERVWRAGGGNPPSTFPLTLSLANRSATTGSLLFRDELASVDDGKSTLAEMCRLDADVVAPFLEGGRLFGLLVAGPKRSASPYFSEDADLLQTLVHQSVVAIRNAQAHQRVLLMNEELQKTLAAIESGVVTVRVRGRLSVLNKAAEQLMGRSAEDLQKGGFEQLPLILKQLIETTLDDGQARSQIEISLPNHAGQVMPLMCTVSPLRSPHGSLAGAVIVFTDLSRLRELERERRRAEGLASLEAIASGMVHEIRNPLVSIKAFTQLLPSRFEDSEFRQKFTRVVGRGIDRVDELLDRFKMLSAASHQPMRPIDLTTPLSDTLSLLQPQLLENRIALRQAIRGPYPPILGNASQLEQLFHNLCLNAIESMGAGGELIVRVADLSLTGGSTLLVEFSDTGSGIPQDLIEQIFNPFVTSKSHGMGLGLAICRAIADAHRANLRARNHIDRSGCTFTVEFPVLSNTNTEASV